MIALYNDYDDLVVLSITLVIALVYLMLAFRVITISLQSYLRDLCSLIMLNAEEEVQRFGTVVLDLSLRREVSKQVVSLLELHWQ